jgi:F-type H+-transporting ATPase subunit gamma
VEPDAHPLLRMPDQSSGTPLLIVISSDRGLCGAFNSNIIKAASNFIQTEAAGRDVALGLIGRKGRDFFRRRGFDVRYEAVGIFQKLSFADAAEIANSAIEEFTSGRVSSVYLVYNEFKSVMTQRLVVERLLPIPRLDPADAGPAGGPSVDYLYEPAPEEIFKTLLPRHVQVQVYRALLESNASFFAAQMTAMDAATRNSKEMIESLTLYMNKVRQAGITREIIEVVSGAAAT